MTIHRFDNGFDVGVLTPEELVADILIFLATGRLQEDDERKGELAFAEVGAEGFASFGFVADKVEQVIIDLVGSAKFQAVLFEGRDAVGAGFANESAKFRRSGKKGGGFHFDDAKIIGGAEFKIESALGLNDFSRTNFGGSIGDATADFGVGKIGGKFKGVGKKAIAEENTDGVAPFGIGGGLIATTVGSVDDVIVDEGGHVDQFQDYGQIDMGGSDFTRGAASENGEGGAQMFAAIVEGVGNVAFHSGIEGPGLFLDALIDGVEVRIDQIEGLFKPET